MESSLSLPTIEELVAAGVHFGHQSRRWHPGMKRYIYGEKNHVHIINVRKTQQAFEKVLPVIEKQAAQGQSILLCATKKAAQELVQQECERVGMFYVNHRWLGGMLTNFSTVQSNIARLKEIETLSEDGTYEKLVKKEIASLERKRAKLERDVGGIKNLKGLPSLLIVIDAGREATAVKEANRLSIPVIGVVDTNTNPDPIEYVIPGNDDSLKSIELYLKLFTGAFEKGKKRFAERKSESAKPQAEASDALEEAFEEVQPLSKD